MSEHGKSYFSWKWNWVQFQSQSSDVNEDRHEYAKSGKMEVSKGQLTLNISMGTKSGVNSSFQTSEQIITFPLSYTTHYVH